MCEQRRNEYETDFGGVYIILNVLECKAYVGQAKKFGNRTHLSDLAGGRDNSGLQACYDAQDHDLIYFKAVVGTQILDKEMLDAYEKLYMTLLEDMGFTLYNHNIQKKDRTFDKLGLGTGEDERAKKALNEDFHIRFEMEAQDLKTLSFEDRKKILEHYMEKRLSDPDEENKLFKSDILIFNRKRISNIINGGLDVKGKSFLDLNKMFISKAGNYINDGLDQILYYEIKAIKDYGYCLWTFANNAVCADTVREHCIERGKKHVDTYVLFTFTASSTYMNKSKNEYLYLKKDSNADVIKKAIDDLHFEEHKKENGQIRYYVPGGIDCTAAGAKSANAFVVQELIMLQETIDKNELSKSYIAVGKKGLYEMNRGGCQRSTFFLQRRDESADIGYDQLFSNKKDRSICFIGKLKAPYIITLETK